jgi:N-acetylglutamate synthase-like GNAT family acetyltransferase
MTASQAIEIRRATERDADGISRVVIRALRETNAKDYPPEVISALVSNFSPEKVAFLIANRQVYIAIAHRIIIGTASLHGSVVRTVFVDPDHRKGIGAKLMDVIESLARASSITRLSLRSSLTAHEFYKKLGYVPVREELHGQERTIIMEKQLAL